MYIPFQELKEDSRIWIFQADRKLTDKEKDRISERVKSFTGQWAAHGKQLKSSFILPNNTHLIVGVDISINNATGCSIDALIHTIQEAGKELDVNFFDRKAVAYEHQGQTDVVKFGDLQSAINKGIISPETITYNNLAASKKDLDNTWQVKAADNWIKKYFSKTTPTT